MRQRPRTTKPASAHRPRRRPARRRLFADALRDLVRDYATEHLADENAVLVIDIGFSTKPQLAAEMIERALAAGVPFRWVAADSVYGVGDIERDLRQADKGYVLGVNSDHWFASWGKSQRVVGTAEEIAKTQRRSDWRRLSAGAGTKGPRLHDWCYLELADLEGEESSHHSQVLWTRGLLIRRNIANGDLAYFTTWWSDG